MQFNTIGLTDRERVLLVAGIVGFYGVFHDADAGRHGARFQRMISHCTQMCPGVGSITLFTDGTAGVLGNLQAGPSTYDELTAFAAKLTTLRPLRKAFATGRSMAAGSGFVANATHVEGIHNGTIDEVARGVPATSPW